MEIRQSSHTKEMSLKFLNKTFFSHKCLGITFWGIIFAQKQSTTLIQVISRTLKPIANQAESSLKPFWKKNIDIKHNKNEYWKIFRIIHYRMITTICIPGQVRPIRFRKKEQYSLESVYRYQKVYLNIHLHACHRRYCFIVIKSIIIIIIIAVINTSSFFVFMIFNSCSNSTNIVIIIIHDR